MPTVESVMASSAGPAVGSSQAGQVTVQRGTYDWVAAESEDSAIQVRQVKLPAGHVIIDCVLDNDALDAVSAGAIDIGLEDTIQLDNDGAADDSTDLLLFATTIDVQTDGNRQNVMSFAAALLGPRNYDRYVVITMETVSTTGVAVRTGITLTSKPHLGDTFDGSA